jgi:hydroxymethylpyrimidine/phosphomethylpyrimidine kinase
MKRALTIAGSDSGGGAGIQADLKTFAAHGVYGMSAITAITAQNTLGVSAVYPIPADIVIAQIEAVAGDIGMDAVKTGMLATAAIVEAVAATIAELDLPNVVVDPVMVAKGGARLLDEDAIEAMKTELLPRARVMTPNAAEAAALLGDNVRTLDQARAAARALKAFGAAAVIVKGGHLEGPEAVDVLFDGREMIELSAPRIPTTSTHGTGCTFASAIAAQLALGASLHEAARRAKAYLTETIRRAPGLGGGHGPVQHIL